ncbi:hypothetical protein JBL43_08020 [Aureibaculum sp. A20]|uniref:Uncharacterized protein n=1 Tax=Aureibaculum flavum TaxID=2795986 RepID=A0ABS0WQC5_9FLAO|nr:hypothetical protein [Aureibaculum flavum]MBJ2174180.1 hypothetical protein [Aureibaculum flavum]
MILEKKFQTLLGTEEQIAEVKSIIEQFDTIKAVVVEHNIVRVPNNELKFIVLNHYELELTAPKEDLNKYFEMLKSNPTVLFVESKKNTHVG